MPGTILNAFLRTSTDSCLLTTISVLWIRKLRHKEYKVIMHCGTPHNSRTPFTETIHSVTLLEPWLGGSVGWSAIPYTKRLIPSQGTYLGCVGSSPSWGAYGRTPTDVSLCHQCFSLSLFLSLSLSPPLPLSLKAINISSGED